MHKWLNDRLFPVMIKMELLNGNYAIALSWNEPLSGELRAMVGSS